MKKIRIEFDDGMKFSMNKLWSGGKAIKWMRMRIAEDWHYYTELALSEKKIGKVKGRCILLFYFQFRKNMLDSSNVAPMAKAIEDTLARKGVLVSDTNAHVEGVYYMSVGLDIEERKKLETNYVDVVIIEEGKDKEYDLIANLRHNG